MLERGCSQEKGVGGQEGGLAPRQPCSSIASVTNTGHRLPAGPSSPNQARSEPHRRWKDGDEDGPGEAGEGHGPSRKAEVTQEAWGGGDGLDS